jgi:hypothetical protein
VSCPHAHQQNGSAERKHRHIVEVGLALLANASMPLKFWDEAFLTATFLINLLPSKVIGFDTPVERLLGTKPNYDSLRIFGCACWPNLCPYNTRKLAFRSKRCVFLGYSPRHKGVKCLDISTGRVYVSRDVVFNEHVFPFAQLHPNVGSRLREEILLLPHSPPTTTGDANIDDYMPLPVVPVVVPPVADTIQGAPENIAEEISVQHDEENHSENGAEEGIQGAENKEDPADGAASAFTDPEEDPSRESPAPAPSPAQSHVAATRLPPVVARRCATSPSRSQPETALPPRAPSLPFMADNPPDSGYVSPPDGGEPNLGSTPGSGASASGSSVPMRRSSGPMRRAARRAPQPSLQVRTWLMKGIQKPRVYNDGTVRYGMLAA